MSWSSISEIENYYLPSDFEGDKPAKLRKILSDIIKELHPDKTAGIFLSKDFEERYHKARAALDLLDDHTSKIPEKLNHDLVVISKHELADFLTSANLQKEVSPPTLRELSKQKIQESDAAFELKIKPIKKKAKIFSTAFALSVLIFIFNIPQHVKDNPFIDGIINNTFLKSVWWGALIIGLFYYVLVLLTNFMNKKFSEFALSEEAIKSNVRMLHHYYRTDGKEVFKRDDIAFFCKHHGANELETTLPKLIKGISESIKKKYPKLHWENLITQKTESEIVDSFWKIAQDCEVVERNSDDKFNESYKLIYLPKNLP